MKKIILTIILIIFIIPSNAYGNHKHHHITNNSNHHRQHHYHHAHHIKAHKSNEEIEEVCFASEEINNIVTKEKCYFMSKKEHEEFEPTEAESIEAEEIIKSAERFEKEY